MNQAKRPVRVISEMYRAKPRSLAAYRTPMQQFLHDYNDLSELSISSFRECEAILESVYSNALFVISRYLLHNVVDRLISLKLGMCTSYKVALRSLDRVRQLNLLKNEIKNVSLNSLSVKKILSISLQPNATLFTSLHEILMEIAQQIFFSVYSHNSGSLHANKDSEEIQNLLSSSPLLAIKRLSKIFAADSNSLSFVLLFEHAEKFSKSLLTELSTELLSLSNNTNDTFEVGVLIVAVQSVQTDVSLYDRRTSADTATRPSVTILADELHNYISNSMWLYDEFFKLILSLKIFPVLLPVELLDSIHRHMKCLDPCVYTSAVERIRMCLMVHYQTGISSLSLFRNDSFVRNSMIGRVANVRRSKVLTDRNRIAMILSVIPRSDVAGLSGLIDAPFITVSELSDFIIDDRIFYSGGDKFAFKVLNATILRNDVDMLWVTVVRVLGRILCPNLISNTTVLELYCGLLMFRKGEQGDTPFQALCAEIKANVVKIEKNQLPNLYSALKFIYDQLLNGVQRKHFFASKDSSQVPPVIETPINSENPLDCSFFSDIDKKSSFNELFLQYAAYCEEFAVSISMLVPEETQAEIPHLPRILSSIATWVSDMNELLCCDLPRPPALSGILQISKGTVNLVVNELNNTNIRGRWRSCFDKQAEHGSEVEKKRGLLYNKVLENSDIRLLYDILYVQNISAASVNFDVLYTEFVRVSKPWISESKAKRMKIESQDDTLEKNNQESDRVAHCRFYSSLEMLERSGVVSTFKSGSKLFVHKEISLWFSK